MATLIDCCNRALAESAAGFISSLDDGSLEARECNRFASALISEISGWHEWGWTVLNVLLAAVDNDRCHEWRFAYALPSDMERPLCVRDNPQYAGGGDQITLPVGMWADVEQHRFPVLGNYPFPAQDASPVAFIIAGETLYTNACNASLHYHQVVTDVGTFPPMLARAFELTLAARIALPLRKDPNLAASINQQAEIARARAIANDINNHPHPPAIFTSDVQFARMGLSDTL